MAGPQAARRRRPAAATALAGLPPPGVGPRCRRRTGPLPPRSQHPGPPRFLARRYPLFVVFGAAATVCTWSVFRQLKSNPDVHLTYAHRSDGAAEEGTTLKRAKEYYNSIFRQAYHLRAEGLVSGPAAQGGREPASRPLLHARLGRRVHPSCAMLLLGLVRAPPMPTERRARPCSPPARRTAPTPASSAKCPSSRHARAAAPPAPSRSCRHAACGRMLLSTREPLRLFLCTCVCLAHMSVSPSCAS